MMKDITKYNDRKDLNQNVNLFENNKIFKS